VSNNLTWLHISDIHFHPKTEWRDSAARAALLTYLGDVFERDGSLRPDLIFCTGDIAFGETSKSPLAEQYKQAETFFDSLLAICGQGDVPLPKERLFVVPGNHDVNRSSINSDAQTTLTMWAGQAREHVSVINQRFNDRPKEFKDAIKRLDEYAQFVQSYLPHQYDADGRQRYSRVVDIDGLKVGIAGFNSAWSCAGPEDDRTLWLAADWQFSTTQVEIKDADIRIGLIHHPSDWLNAAEQDFATRRVAAGFDFWLHGHIHNAWVVPAQSHITVAAGAVGAETVDEFGVNLIRLDLAESTGVVHLHAYSPRDSGWTIAPVARYASAGQWPFDLPARLRRSPATSPAAATNDTSALPKRTPGLFGREALIKDITAKLHDHPFLFVYGLRGNGKSALIKALGQVPPLASKELVPYVITPSTTADDLFRQFATLLGETAEFPKCPSGDANEIAAELRRRYPKPRPAWVWIDRAHHFLDAKGFLHPVFRNLLLGMYTALGMKWHWVLESRERPDLESLGASVVEVNVPGLDKASLAAS
jgi:predicted MPP superfamily phosphohydrolase